MNYSISSPKYVDIFAPLRKGIWIQIIWSKLNQTSIAECPLGFHSSMQISIGWYAAGFTSKL
jgi:hypothetical protein